jgi:hypothetical protein
MSRVSVKITAVNDRVFAILLGLFIGLFIPGDFNPAHIFSIAICGFCGLVFYLVRRKSVITAIGICVIIIMVSWPIAIALRDASDILMPDRITGQHVYGWLCWLLPPALFFSGIIHWRQTRSWLVFAIAVIPLSVLIGYISLRSPTTKLIDRIEWCGIYVSGSAKDGYAIFIDPDRTDNVIRDVYEDLKKLTGLHMVFIKSKKITGEGVCLLAKLPKIDCMRLDSVQVSREAIQCMSEMPNLHKLIMQEMSFDARDISFLGNSQSLQFLEIDDCMIGDEVIDHIAKIKTLDFVSLFDTDVSSKAIDELKIKRPDLKVGYFGKDKTSNIEKNKEDNDKP